MTRPFEGGRPDACGRRPPGLLLVTMIVLTGALALSGARAVTTPTLAHATTFVGSSPAKIVVTLAKEAIYQGFCLSSPNALISGGGRFPALVLLRDTPSRTEKPLLVARYPSEAGGYVHSSSCSEQPVTLAPGQYLVYLLPDGAPVAITLWFGGLSGSATLAPPIPIAQQLLFPETVISEPTGALYSGGGNGSLRSRGMLFHTVWTQSSATLLTEAGSCTNIASKSRYPAKLRYTPPTCMAGGGVYGINDFPLSAPAHHSFMQWGAPPDVYGVGGYVMGAGLYRDTGMLCLWLSYD